jgi:hypothetical protein
MLIEIGEMNKREWIDEDEFSAIDDDERVPSLSPTDILNQGVADEAVEDEQRQRLMHYFEEHYYF